MSKKEKGSLRRQPIPDEEDVEMATELFAALFLRQLVGEQRTKGTKTIKRDRQKIKN